MHLALLPLLYTRVSSMRIFFELCSVRLVRKTLMLSRKPDARAAVFLLAELLPEVEADSPNSTSSLVAALEGNSTHGCGVQRDVGG